MNLPLHTRALPPPLVLKTPLLLAEWCPVNAPDWQNLPAAQPFTLRAIKITTVLQQIISPIGWRHGGIND